jgi:hypothetical protein
VLNLDPDVSLLLTATLLKAPATGPRGIDDLVKSCPDAYPERLVITTPCPEPSTDPIQLWILASAWCWHRGNLAGEASTQEFVTHPKAEPQTAVCTKRERRCIRNKTAIFAK